MNSKIFHFGVLLVRVMGASLSTNIKAGEAGMFISPYAPNWSWKSPQNSETGEEHNGVKPETVGLHVAN